MLDRKTREHVDFLAARARRFGNHYINNAIIPILFGMVGVPTADVRGNITSHRARSTIASQLYNGAFLRHLETNRGNTASARNARPPRSIRSSATPFCGSRNTPTRAVDPVGARRPRDRQLPYSQRNRRTDSTLRTRPPGPGGGRPRRVRRRASAGGSGIATRGWSPTPTRSPCSSHPPSTSVRPTRPSLTPCLTRGVEEVEIHALQPRLLGRRCQRQPGLPPHIARHAVGVPVEPQRIRIRVTGRRKPVVVSRHDVDRRHQIRGRAPPPESVSRYSRSRDSSGPRKALDRRAMLKPWGRPANQSRAVVAVCVAEWADCSIVGNQFRSER